MVESIHFNNILRKSSLDFGLALGVALPVGTWPAGVETVVFRSSAVGISVDSFCLTSLEVKRRVNRI